MLDTKLTFRKYLDFNSIRELAFYVSGFISIISAGLIFLFYEYISDDIKYISILFILLFVVSYVTIYVVLKYYIHNRIALIYKIIRSTRKSSPISSPPISQTNILSEVQREAQEWSDKQRNEMASLQSLEQYRKDFLGNVSHELKTPLFNIQGYLMTLSDGGLYDADINMNYIKKALINVERLDTILGDLTVMSKLDSDQLVLNNTRFDLGELIHNVINSLQLRAKEKHITLHFNQKQLDDVYVRADQEFIRQVLTNLVMNSIRYGVDNGQTSIDYFFMDRTVLVEITDNGVGIAEKHHPHLFDRFYRVDESRSRHLGGSGIGLAIVKHIMEAHNQNITVKSTLGEGSTFGITLDRD